MLDSPAPPISSRAAVLLTLLQLGRAYGALMIRHVAHCSAGKLIMDKPALYRVLPLLENAGILSSEVELKQGRGHPRWYALTAAGRVEAEGLRNFFRTMAL